VNRVRQPPESAFAEAGLKTGGYVFAYLPTLLLTVLYTIAPVRAVGAQPHSAASARGTLQGVVLYHDAALGLFVQAGGETVQVAGLQGTAFAPGDRVNVTGVAIEKDGRRTMSEATVTRVGAGALPAASRRRGSPPTRIPTTGCRSWR
jgi:hypothetical protein